jgi:alanine dehydrogenase
MRIGVPREIKTDEYRVGLLPVGAELLVADGHAVQVQRGAGVGSGFEDSAYAAAGAKVVDSAEELYASADLIVKVKEPQAPELRLLQSGQLVFCYFHFAADRGLTEGCLQRGITALAYETLRDGAGGLPLLRPMSEVAGKMSVQEGAKYLEKPQGGRGLLLGGVTGVEPANVLILGAGVVGSNAARVAAGLGAYVTLLDVDLDRLRHLSEVMPANVVGVYNDPHSLRQHLPAADLVIGAVLTPGARAPMLVDRALLRTMRPGAVVVDVSVDQGGCFETTRPTTHRAPTYVMEEVVHYCVTNIPSAVARTSSLSLCHATLPYLRQLAALGLEGFCADSCRAAAVNLRAGRIANPAVAAAFGDLPRADR